MMISNKVNCAEIVPNELLLYIYNARLYQLLDLTLAMCGNILKLNKMIQFSMANDDLQRYEVNFAEIVPNKLLYIECQTTLTVIYIMSPD